MGIDWETLLDAECEDLQDAYDTLVEDVQISESYLDD